jgi:indole-3-glycerol phosphate synthase/phosphoribosylanthranilate isomerase
MTILQEIAQRRQQRLDVEGFGLGVEIPHERLVPITPFMAKNGLICEVKRKSPSKGVINAQLDPVKQGALYKQSGAGNISVLTEEDYFGGSLADLIALKQAHPEV